MGSTPRPTTVSGGVDPLDVVRVVRLAGGALFDQARLHGQLAGIEWQEDKSRLLKMVAAALLGFASLLCALLFTGGLALAATWETAYRFPTLAALAIAFGCGAFAAWHRFQAWSALGRRSFAASREELAADAALLRACT